MKQKTQIVMLPSLDGWGGGGGNAILWIKLCPVDDVIGFLHYYSLDRMEIHPVDSAIRKKNEA